MEDNDSIYIPDFDEQDQGQEETKIEVIKSKETKTVTEKEIVTKTYINTNPPEPESLGIKLRTERIIRGRNHGIRLSRRWRSMSGDEKRNYLAVEFEEALTYLKAVRQGLIIENEEYTSELDEETREELRRNDRKYRSAKNLTVEIKADKKTDRKKSINKLIEELGEGMDYEALIKESQERMKASKEVKES